ncbi:DUF4143 domain-containing protein [Candidatus Fermentibacteria bacterium]|nr:DUF4143 domain-containing protein [Candidatus Fermentibacteria bacterium]
MIDRAFWLNRITSAWHTRSIVWLSGVRRVGKTTLARMIPDTVFLNCELPSAARRLEDPELFFGSLDPDSTVILDEIHRLADPSIVLKTASDEFPGMRVLATGSSTLSATKKFRDSLTGRKWSVYLAPVLWDECLGEFGIRDLDRRLLHGGLPEQLLSDDQDPEFYGEWLDSYYARDVAELFSVRNRGGFLALLRLLFWQSGGLADISKLASDCGVSRPTVNSYLDGMSIAHAVFRLSPFSGAGRREIIRRQKIYAFDTGFVVYARAWQTIRPEDRGLLWEHLVLDTLRASGRERGLRYWRDKSGREVDFVVRSGEDSIDAFECKIDPDNFDPGHLRHFRSFYPEGINYLVCPHVAESYRRDFSGVGVRVVSTKHLLDAMGG